MKQFVLRMYVTSTRSLDKEIFNTFKITNKCSQVKFCAQIITLTEHCVEQYLEVSFISIGQNHHAEICLKGFYKLLHQMTPAKGAFTPAMFDPVQSNSFPP